MRKLILQTAAIVCFAILWGTAALAQVPPWSVNPASFGNSMNVTAQVYLDNVEENGSANYLAAFVGNEVRGVASPTIVGGKAYYFLTVFSNSVSGETVDFKVFLATPNTIHPAVETAVFLKNAQLGNYPDGFALHLSALNDFDIELLPIPSDSTLVGYPFSGIGLDDYLLSQDNDPVVWSVVNGTNISGTIGAGNVLAVTPNDPTWTGTDSLFVKATETGTTNAFAASQYVRFKVGPDYGMPEFGGSPVQFVQDDVPLPGGNLSNLLDFDGPCVEYSVEMMLPEGTVAMPNWTQPGTNSGSMSLMVQADFGGDLISGASNKMAGFVNGQLAGVASPQIVSGKELYFLTLANVGTGAITFKFYDAAHQYLHEKATGINFVPTGSLGDFNNPYIVDFAPILVNLLPDGTWTTTILDASWAGEQHVMFFVKDCLYGDKVDSLEVVFLVKQCPSEIVELPAGFGLCLQADAGVSQVTWYMDGAAEVGDGPFYGALVPGVYHYEGLTAADCPDLKSCPVIVTVNTSPTPSGNQPTAPKATAPPTPECGQLSLVGISVDDSPPSAVCKAATIYLDNNGAAVLTPADVDDNSFTNCGVGVVTISQEDFACQHLGTNTVVLNILDAAGRSANCNATVTVQDTIRPTAVCQNFGVALDGVGQAMVTPASVLASGNDNCGTVNLQSLAPNVFDCSDLGNNLVTLTVNDGNGNTNTCTATVVVVDDTAPTVACKNHTLYMNAIGIGNIIPADVFQSFTDNCGSYNLVSVVPSAFSCSTYGPNTVTLTINDTHGSTATCTATVTVVDNVPPVAICKDATVSLNANGSYTLLPATVYQSGSDNCGTVTPVTVTPNQFGCNNAGANPVTLTVQDSHGNSSTCTAIVTIAGQSGPVAVCNNLTVNLGADGQAAITAAQVGGNSMATCGSVNIMAAPLSFTCADLGANTVTVTVTDMAGSVATCSAIVTIHDATAPVAHCKDITVPLNPDGSLSITAAQLENGSTDNCGIATRSVSPANFSCANVGANTVTLTVKDASNNQSTCTATVTIPVFMTINSVFVTNSLCGLGNGSIVVNANTGGGQLGYSLNGGGSFQYSNTFSNLTPGDYVVTVVAFGTANCLATTGTLTVGTGGAATWFKDTDNDGYSTGDSLVDCSQPAGYKLLEHLLAAPIAGNIDCQDANPNIYPGALELCNGIDDDCNGLAESTENTWTGLGNGTLWSDPANWSDGIVPMDCQDVIVPTGKVVIVPAGFHAVGRTLDVQLSAELTVELTGTVEIED